MRYDLTAGDLDPPIGTQLSGVTPPLPPGTTVQFIMVQADGSAIVQGQGVLDDPNLMTAHYEWQPGDTAIPGVYRGKWRVVYPSGRPTTFPSDEPLYVVIHPMEGPFQFVEAIDASVSADHAT